MITIRRAEPADAERALAYVRALFAEADRFTLTEADEFSMTVEQERAHFASVDWDGGSQYWLAVDEAGAVVGMLTGSPGRRRKTFHRFELGMSVAASHRRQGLGRRLLEHCIAHCRAHPRLQKVALTVLSDNVRALPLYESLGFVVEGRGVKDVLRRDGSYVDQVFMGLWLA